MAEAPFLILPGGLTFVLAAAVVSRPPRPTGSPGQAVEREGRARPATLPRSAILSPAVWIATGLLVLGVSTALLGASALALSPPAPTPGTGGAPGIGLALAAVAGIGLGLGAIVIPGRVILQQRPPRELRARVIAGQLTLANAAAVIPLLVGGSLADRLGLGPVMIALGALAVLTGLAGAGYLRRARFDPL